MARAGNPKIDFYPDEEAQELLKNLPPNTRSATLNNLVKAYLSTSLESREEAQTRLAEVIRRRNGTSKSPYAGSYVDTINSLQRVFQHLCRKHSISTTRDALQLGTAKFYQAVRELDVDPETENLEENLIVQSAFFKTVAEMRFWQSELAYQVPEGELHISSDKWKADHPPLIGGVLIGDINENQSAQDVITAFHYGQRSCYLDEGQPYVCQWKENGELKERHLTA